MILGGRSDLGAEALSRRARRDSRTTLGKSHNLVERTAPHSQQDFDRVQEAIPRHPPNGDAIHAR